MTLRLFTNDYDWVVAEDLNDVLFVMVEHTGYESLAEYQEDTGDEISGWREIPSNEMITFYNEDEDGDREDKNKVTKRASEWVDEKGGRGWLCGDM